MYSMKFLLFIPLAALCSSVASGQNLSEKMTNQAIVEQFLNGFNNPAELENSLALLADDYHFSNPMVALHSKTEFIALAQQIGAILTGVELIELAGNGEWVAAFYEFRSSLPGVESNLATEWFRLEDGIIKESRLIYDASEWRKIYAQMEEQ